MGTVMDLFQNSKHDFVDNPYWSVMQIKAKRFTLKEWITFGSTDYGKVILIATMTLDKKRETESD